MNASTKIAVLATCSLLAAACAAKTATPPGPTMTSSTTSTEKGGSRQNVIELRATVEKVDVKNRLVTLRGPDGNKQTIAVGEEVRNLPQLERGDQVIVTYYQAVAFQVLEPGTAEPDVTGGHAAVRAEPGEKPGGMAARVVTLVADVVSLNREAEQAVLRGPEGDILTVHVQNPENFDKVKIGDTVAIRVTEALAIDVEPATK